MRQFLATCVLFAASVSAGELVVSNDEWQFSDFGINRNQEKQFASNVTSFLTGGGTDILIWSNNFGLTGAAFQTYLTGLGYSLTVTTAPQTLAQLQGYDAVFVSGFAQDNSTLIDYIDGGGGVYLNAGTATIAGGSAGEAAAWKTLLNHYGLEFQTSYNGVGGDIDVSAYQTQLPLGPTLFNGVSKLYQNNGSGIIDLGTNPNAQLFGDGLYAALTTGTAEVPEPSAFILVGAGLVLMSIRRIRS